MTDYFVDALGDMCPIPNLKARRQLHAAAAGDVIVVETDHSCAALSLEKEMKRLGHRVTVTEVAAGVWQVAVRKGH